PTGRRHVQAIDGEEPEPHARPGTGSTDLLGGLQVVQVVPLPARSGGSTVFASALYTYTGRGVDDYRMGRMFEGHLGLSFPLLDRLMVLAQASGQMRAKDRTEGTEAVAGGAHSDHTAGAAGTSIVHENTGGTAVFIAPGLRCEISPSLAVSAYLQL